jgi:transglutaminase-like putative cysteine protease
MTYRVKHETIYSYSEPVMLCHNVLRLMPRCTDRQTCLWSNLGVYPTPAVSSRSTDYFGNNSIYFTVQDRHEQLTITMTSEAVVRPADLIHSEHSPPWDDVAERLARSRDAIDLEAYHYAFDSPYVAASRKLAAYAAPSFPPGRPLIEAMLDLTRRIHGEFRFDNRATTVTTPLHEVLETRVGVCQDFAHLQIGCVRSMGLAARYVSGYLLTQPPPGKPRLIGADASHAWLSVYCPGLGWIDLDPTNNQIASDKHITVAWGRDYDDVSPIKGVILGGGRQSISVAVDVIPLEEEVLEAE